MEALLVIAPPPRCAFSHSRRSRPVLVCAGLAAVLLAAVLLEACADDTPTTPTPDDADSATLAMAFKGDSTPIVIEPHWLTLDTVGVTDTLTATVINAAGDTIDDAEVTWASSDTAIVTVDTAGVVTSVEFGKAKVSATYDSATAEATVEVALPLTDREILEIFYEATGGDDWTDKTNWLSDEDLDEWYGVGAYQGKVSSLSLNDNNLVGEIPPELGGLDELFTLHLHRNKLSGPIPAELSKFNELRDLYLNDNAGISGRLPPELGYTGGLEYFRINDTNLSGPLPLTFANLDLTRFYFDGDGVCIPAALEAWLDSIPEKEKDYKICTDEITLDPPSLYIEAPPLGDTTRLAAAVISAEGDTVHDAAVTWSSADTSIATVDSTGLVTSVGYGTAEVTATSDSLTATAEVEIVFKLSDRQVLDTLFRVTGGETWTDTTNWLSDEPLSEWVGVETNEAGKVVKLSLGGNNLTGSIPAVLAVLDDLVTLDLSRNTLTGGIPGGLRELEQLRDLLLHQNELEGPLHPDLGSMAGLRYLHVGSNKLGGVVPGSFANLEMDTLFAAGSGVCVPPSLGDWFEGIEQTDDATRCVASIAIKVVDLPSLTFYAPGETGTLSANYVSAEGDTTHDASVTWSSGDTDVVSVDAAGVVTAAGDGKTEITASYDSTTGNIAVEVALPENDRDVLEILYDRARGDGWTDATNWLSDEPLSAWAGVETDDSGRVVGLSLRGNNVRGPIHASIGKLGRLVSLDLSGNWISGSIPAEVGDLSLLREFGLSVNGLVGEVPSVLGALDSLKTFNVAATSLSGLVPASFADLELESFLVRGTELCVPPSLAEWLDSIAETDDPPECTTRVLVDPGSLTFGAAGDTARLSVTVIGPEGDVVESPAITWTSADTRVARVDTAGLVTARYSGVTTVTATYDSVTTGAAEVAVKLSGSDRVALEAFYRATGGDDWKDNTNWLSDEPLGEWHGVRVDRTGRVKYLKLYNNNLTGRIPAAIGLLDSLFRLELRDTTLTGPIPPAIGRLSAIRDLILGGTHIDGFLPPEMGNMTGLSYAYLSGTRLSGPLPETLANLDVSWFYIGNTDVCLPRSLASWYESREHTSGDLFPCIPETADRDVLTILYNATGGPQWLRNRNWLTDKNLNTWSGIATDGEGYVTEIFVPRNNLTDSIPPQLANLTRLEVLALYGNELTGRLPPELGKLTKVRDLLLSSNKLEGPIPPELGGMVSVDTMYLSKNQLSGPIPATFGNLAGLEHLALFENQLSGPLPAEFGMLKKLKTIWLTDNQIEGPLPPELGDMTALEALSLHKNRISGMIPPELGKLQALKSLDLSDNQLTGPIPPELGNLASLEVMFLMRNALSGSIPTELGKLSNLEWLWLFKNELTGSIPAALGDLAKLKELSIGNDSLSGPIPPELGRLSALEQLHASGSNLSGPIPPELGNLSSLIYLYLFNNNLSGTIPAELGNLGALTKLALSDNQLTGSIPAELGNLGALTELALSDNQLTGSIPAELGNLGALTELALRDNQLTGSIPAELGNLGALTELALRDNQLTGSIPPELGQLSKLEVLRLQNNSLSGALPPELGSLTAAEELDVTNSPQLTGLLPRTLADLQSIWHFYFNKTDLCPHLDREFQDWLDKIPKVDSNECGAPDIERLALSEFYEETGGDSWTNNDGWDSDSPTGDWYGVTVSADDSLVRRLDLPDNGLVGPLPAVIANLRALETLDLADNTLNEEFPVAMASMDALDTIRISGNADMEGPLPFRMIDLTDLKAIQYADTDLCASPSGTFQDWIDDLDIADGATCDNPDEVKLSLPVVYLNQAIQRPEGDVPLLKDRETLLRVFLVGDKENAFFEPEVFATFTRDGKEVHRVVMPSEQDRVATFADEGSLLKSYNAVIPAKHIVKGTEFVIVADSAETIPRAAGSQTRFPETGSAALDVIEVPPMELTVVPVLNAEKPDSSIFPWVDSIADLGEESPQVGLFKYSFPFSEFSAKTRETHVTSLDLTVEDNTWPMVLELEKVYKAEEATGYWYAVAYSQDGYVRGIARLNGWVSFGKPQDAELAHEVGHNLDLLHAPCGPALGTDPDFPYDNGSIGMWGYDFRDGSLVSPQRRRDIMGYCYNKGWLSDYYFEKVIRVREEKEGDDAEPQIGAAGPKGQMLVLWGGVLNGELRIEPVHPMYTAATLPEEAGPYRLDGITRGGDVEFSLSFTPGEDVYGNKYFLFTIPIEEDWENSLERITLTGPEGEVTVDSGDRRSITVVTDPSTGRIRAILRDWDRGLPAVLGDTDGLVVETTRGILEAVRLR